jgi:hypothetical protein
MAKEGPRPGLSRFGSTEAHNSYPLLNTGRPTDLLTTTCLFTAPVLPASGCDPSGAVVRRGAMTPVALRQVTGAARPMPPPQGCPTRIEPMLTTTETASLCYPSLSQWCRPSAVIVKPRSLPFGPLFQR